MKQQKPHKRKFIEIYFVLYLAALILLIPDKRGEVRTANELVMGLLQSSFTIQAQRNALICKVVRSSNGNAIISCDSINTLLHTGNVSDVQYTIEIEDQSLDRIIQTLSFDNQFAQSFRLIGNSNSGFAQFKWTPNFQERSNRLYKARVIASAKPALPAMLSAQQRQNLESVIGNARLSAETTFSIALLFVDGGSSPTTTVLAQNELQQNDSSTRKEIASLLAELQRAREAQSLVNGAGTSAVANKVTSTEFKMQSMFDEIKTIPYGQWENRIRLEGLNSSRDLFGSPTFVVHSPNGGKVRIDTVLGNEIVIEGQAPASGEQRITVYATRAIDKVTLERPFIVRPTPLSKATIPTEMYPGVSYEFAPNLPIITSQTTAAYLQDERGNVVATSSQGEPFDFTPSLNDTGKMLQFVRTIGGNKVGQTLAVKVVNFARPEIIDIVQLPQGSIRIRTRSYGLENDTKSRVRLEILTKGENKPREKYGDYQYNRQYNAHIQVFEVTPNNATITVKATDSYGKSSLQRDINK